MNLARLGLRGTGNVCRCMARIAEFLTQKMKIKVFYSRLRKSIKVLCGCRDLVFRVLIPLQIGSVYPIQI